MPTFAAVDLGASGGRVVAGIVTGDDLRIEVVHRFPNGAQQVDGHLRWPFDELHRQVLAGLAKVPHPTSIGIDTWGVDYGLLGEEGRLLASPISYRDDRTSAVADDVHAFFPPEELFAVNGLQPLPFTTLYQLVAEQRGPHWDDVAHVVLLPDLVAHRLTGVLGTEVTNASTTGLLDATTQQWSTELLERVGLPLDVLPALQPPGEQRGVTRAGVPVVTVASHDTASAVVGVPASCDRFAYVACGTWALVGLELDRPVLSEAARQARFTNEVGLDGTTRFLRNVGGLWLLQECLRAWGRDDLPALLAAAATVAPGGPRIAVDDPALLAPGGMPDRIAAAAGAAMDPPQAVRCILDSLASAFARTIHQAAALADQAVDVVHLVGGGAQSELLCQLTADAARLPVVAGPVEATAIGNVLVQARACGAAPATLEGLRRLGAEAIPLRRFEPR